MSQSVVSQCGDARPAAAPEMPASLVEDQAANGMVSLRLAQTQAMHQLTEVSNCLAEIMADLETSAAGPRRAEEALRQANEQLAAWLARLEQRTREISLLNEMEDRLQISRDIEDAYAVIARFSQTLFAAPQGALFILSPENLRLEAVAAWGDFPHDKRQFPADHCWVLRRGRAGMTDSLSSDLRCPHAVPSAGRVTLCAPLLAQNDTLGVLHLQLDQPLDQPLDQQALACLHDDEGQAPGAAERLVAALADRAALALANLRLCETLRSQAIRDPVTGLFNRRYLEETLAREVHRAARRGATLGIIMLDIDHLKHFNDSYGHQAGDALLRAVGKYLQDHTRGEDIVCRYGGDEFILILPETPLPALELRAEQLRLGVSQLKIEHDRVMIGPATLSAGAAIYPDHGLTGDVVLRAADTALYRAKASGRNHIFTANPPATSPPNR